ncbi:hypothetical protein LPJ74_005488 [Coemansia sp. RSA 1843]|nr:hypothetical protein LPJ74_005488 [Coemansia sp. RSA 1843]
MLVCYFPYLVFTFNLFRTLYTRGIVRSFDPVYALIAEDLIIRKIGQDEWNRIVEQDSNESGSFMVKFLRLVKSFMCTPDPRKNMMFSRQTWEVNPTPTKLKNFMRFDDVVGEEREFINKYSGIRDLLTSDKIVDIVDTKNIIAFKDGVLDIDRFEEGIRDGLPQDFVTISINYKILPKFNQDEHMKQEENMNIGVLKELTGNDTIYVRNLYDNPRTINVKCKFILVTNKVYNLSQADEATWARIKVLPFTSKFTSDRDLVNESEGVFLMNPRYIRIAKDLAPYFMMLLMEYYPKYKRDGLPRCPKVEEQTATLRRLNSPVSLFIEDELGFDPECSIKFQEAYEQYTSYARNNCGLRSVTAANFLANLEKLEVKVIEGNIIGYYLKND